MRWTIKPRPSRQKVAQLTKTLGVDEVIATLLIQRGIETYQQAEAFFRPSLDGLHDPYTMRDMDKAVKRIEEATNRGENILIYGDYDVDGTSSVAMLFSYLTSYYDNVATYIPDRYDEGYGVSFKGIDFAEDNDFSLIIALDCGVKAVDKVGYASEKGIDFIICDHHRPGPELPQAIAVLDPKREDCEYPYKELCGCGVGFKLIQALGQQRGQTLNDLLEYLDLVATAIAADIVPITGENRVLAFHGLGVINENPRPGIKAILEHVNKPSLTITDVVFILAPRINAAGRMKHGNHAVALLTELDEVVAREFAQEIDGFNKDRRETDVKITEEALALIEQNVEQDRKTTVVFDPNWHKGVIGIVASRLIETYYRPTVVFTKSGDVLAASVRSVRGFDVYKALEKCSDYLLQFGGHKYAAGLTLKESDYEGFKAQFEKVVSETIEPSMLTPEVSIDMEIQLSDITPKFYRIIKQFSPFGPGNMTPIFMSTMVKETGWAKTVGEDKKHLKATVSQGEHVFGAIGFGLANKLDLVSSGAPFKIAYNIDENHWQGRTQLQLKLKDIQS